MLLFYYFLLTKNKVARDRKNVPNKKKKILGNYIHVFAAGLWNEPANVRVKEKVQIAEIS